MKVFIKNLYGINDGKKAYYRKQGSGCFEFVNDVKYASELTKEEAEKIKLHKKWYMDQFEANEMSIEE